MMTTLKIKTGTMALMAAVAFAGAAHAHPRLLASSPAANTVAIAPAVIKLSFSERLVAKMTAADLLMTGMKGMPHHPATKVGGVKAALAADGKTLVLTTAKPLSAGTYQVNWRAVTMDTHRVQGSFIFAVK